MSAPKISYPMQAGILEQTVKNLIEDIENFNRAPLGPSRQIARELLEMSLSRAKETLQKIASGEHVGCT